MYDIPFIVYPNIIYLNALDVENVFKLNKYEKTTLHSLAFVWDTSGVNNLVQGLYSTRRRLKISAAYIRTKQNRNSLRYFKTNIKMNIIPFIPTTFSPTDTMHSK